MADGSDASLMIRCEVIVRVQKSQDLLESLFKLVLCSRKGVEAFVQEKPFTNVLLSPYLTL
jgi:hypothetical protein